MSVLRPLPPRPNLEFERKEAKALLRRVRAGDADALDRVRAQHRASHALTDEPFRLADAQLVIAREYGFASWPKLVRYFEDVERQRHALRQRHPQTRERYEASVRGLLREFATRRVWAARQLASYVPRFYGMPVNDIFASDVTEDDARLAIARMHGEPSWESLLEAVGSIPFRNTDPWYTDPIRFAHTAIEAADIDALQRVCEEYPELLQPTRDDQSVGRTLIESALQAERPLGREHMRPVLAWLEARGFDAHLQLNEQLCGGLRMEPDTVRYLLERGANPNWVAPSGIPVLEHALIRYWNGEAIDLLAAHVVPRKALWIAAGLGDVAGVAAFLDRNGKPIAAARNLRPNFDAVGPFPMPTHPEPSDEELLAEAFFIAMLNGRTAVCEYLASRGFDVNTLVYGSPMINIAVGNAMIPMVECLIRCGADLDLRGWRPNQSAREMVRSLLQNSRPGDVYVRVAELCGVSPNEVFAAIPQPPAIDPTLQSALELASDDAIRVGQSGITPENLFFGLLRAGGITTFMILQVSRMNLAQFRADVAERIEHGEQRAEGTMLPLDADAQAAIDAATSLATEKRRSAVNGEHLLHVLTRSEESAAGKLFARYGATARVVHDALARSL